MKTRGGEVRNAAKRVRSAQQGKTKVKVKVKVKSGMVGLRPPTATLRAAHDSTASNNRRGNTRLPQPVSSADGLQRRAPPASPGHRQQGDGEEARQPTPKPRHQQDADWRKDTGYAPIGNANVLGSGIRGHGCYSAGSETYGRSRCHRPPHRPRP